MAGDLAMNVQWTSRRAFLLAAVGAAVGLGNIWKFPYITGTNGGSAFVLVYLLCAFIIAVPILIAELAIGRRGAASPPTAVGTAAIAAGRSPAWRWLGWLGVLSGFLILSFYSVIGGWAVAFTVKAGSGSLTGASDEFDALLASPWLLLLWHSVFMGIVALIIARGLQAGIELVVRWLMPALLVMLCILVGYGTVNGGMGAALEFLFTPDFSKLDSGVILTAIGQAFFSIGVAMGLMMAYGAYLPKQVAIGRVALVIAAADTGVALLAGLAIFPIVFAGNLDPGQGAGLLFTTLPTAFASMPGGVVFAFLFFVLLVFAALTSAIGILEPMVSRLAEGRWSRPRATIVASAGAWAIGILSVLSFNVWVDWFPLAALDVDVFRTKTWFDLIDYFTANVTMPLGGLLLAVFVGWWLPKQMLQSELGDHRWFGLWFGLTRYVVPIAIGIVFIANLA